MSFLGALVANPTLVLQHRNIFLLSHMRANTSLFGHLIGSHPLVEGYYEMHIGYHSWKSLWRQKLRHFADHPAKPAARYMFDKVLHDGHRVDPRLLIRARSRTIMMLRSPEQSIKSLVALYRERRPDLPEATAQGAADYYINRLRTLADTAGMLGSQYFYLDAECLITDTERALHALSAWLQLPTPIPTEYDTFSNTGRGDAGDHSSRLKSGKVNRSKSEYADIDIPAALMLQAQHSYQRHRGQLLAGSAANAAA